MYHKTEQVILYHSLPLYDKVCQWLAAGQCFTPGIPVTPTNEIGQNIYKIYHAYTKIGQK